MVHSYGQKYDPLLMARPAFWRMTIWIDVIWNGPFYVAAIYAISRGREWIRVPALIWSGSMSAVVLIILAEEYNGIHASPHFPIRAAAQHPLARAAARHHHPDGPRASVHQARARPRRGARPGTASAWPRPLSALGRAQSALALPSAGGTA